MPAPHSCRSEDELDDLEEETSRRFGRLPPVARDFLRLRELRLDCKRRGIVRLDVGPGAVAATFLPGRLRKSKGKFSGKSKEKSKGKFEGRSLQRDGDRVVYHSQMRDAPFDLVDELLDLLDET